MSRGLCSLAKVTTQRCIRCNNLLKGQKIYNLVNTDRGENFLGQAAVQVVNYRMQQY